LRGCQTASESELRKMAAQDREKGKLEFVYYLEAVADQRERGVSLDLISPSQKKRCTALL